MHWSHHHRRRVVALSLALLVSLALLLAVGFSLMEIGHHCAGEACPVCLNLFSLRALLTQFAPLALLGYALYRYFAPSRGSERYDTAPFATDTLVTLFMRMND